MAQASPEDSAELIPVGRIRRPSGLKGELAIDAYSGDPGRFKRGLRLVIDGATFTVASARRGPRQSVVLSLEEIGDPDEAAALRGLEILVPSNELPATPEGVYYHYQLIGLTVGTVDGKLLGTLTEIMETGGNDVYVVRSAGRQETLVPALKEVIVDIDLGAGTMTIDPPPGLIP